MKYTYIDTYNGLNEMVEIMTGSLSLSIDTEFEEYKTRKELYLIQIHDGDTIYIIDTVRLKKLEPLAPVLMHDNAEWVLHSGSSDVEFLLDALNLTHPPRIFDTQVAWALLGPESQVSLAYLQYRLLGIRSNKTHQADDLSVRPLSRSQLEYAAGDVAYLPEMRKKLGESLEEKNFSELVYDVSREFCLRKKKTIKKLSMSNFRNAWQLDPSGLSALHYMIEWYNGLTDDERKTVPKKDVLFSIARQMPSTGSELMKIKGVPGRFAAKQGNSFIGKIQKAGNNSQPSGHSIITPTAYATFEEHHTRAWLGMARSYISEKLSMAPEIAFPGSILNDMQEAVLRTGKKKSSMEVLSGWRKDLLYEELSNFIENGMQLWNH